MFFVEMHFAFKDEPTQMVTDFASDHLIIIIVLTQLRAMVSANVARRRRSSVLHYVRVRAFVL